MPFQGHCAGMLQICQKVWNPLWDVTSVIAHTGYNLGDELAKKIFVILCYFAVVQNFWVQYLPGHVLVEGLLGPLLLKVKHCSTIRLNAILTREKYLAKRVNKTF